MTPPPRSIERLQKLLALANDSDSPESRAAQALYERLLRGYGLNREAVEGGEPRWHTVSYTRGDKLIVVRIIIHFQWPARVGKKRQTIRVQCTKQELKTLRDLYRHARGVAEAERKRLALIHKSFVLGYLDRAFPTKWFNRTCPSCGLDYYNYSDERRRFICGKCGHKGRTLSDWEGDHAAYLAGIRLGSRALTGNRLPDGQRPVVVFIDDREEAPHTWPRRDRPANARRSGGNTKGTA